MRKSGLHGPKPRSHRGLCEKFPLRPVQFGVAPGGKLGGGAGFDCQPGLTVGDCASADVCCNSLTSPGKPAKFRVTHQDESIDDAGALERAREREAEPPSTTRPVM
jgi:hypothetical protein